ncbi:uncharacterized protein VTP21DRAFT_5825 [Calcarisporiella thermophila]|uniref:uncharacterized protein n=1 Tax=Calcarisporiella thermophila TaxID=911321 RepID=UPI003743E7D3
MSSKEPQTVDVSELPLPQLQQIKTQLEEELSHLTNSYAQLRSAQAKFVDCGESVKMLSQSDAERPILVPLTSSLYVPGAIADVEKVIVDIGTGYFVEKQTKDAVEFYKNKVEFLRGNLEKLQQVINTKQSNLRVVVGVMQDKIARTATSIGKE